MKRVLVPLATGFEEIEAVTVIDILRRAGAEVVVASLEYGAVTGSRGVQVVPDTLLSDVATAEFDAIVLPGGRGGTDRLRDDPRVAALARNQLQAGRLVGAICAAPEALHAAGLLDGRTITSHPSSRHKLTQVAYVEDRVVRDGLLITSRSPGTALEFAFALVERLFGEEKVTEINSTVLARL